MPSNINGQNSTQEPVNGDSRCGADTSKKASRAEQLESFIDDLEDYIDSVRASTPKYQVLGDYGQLHVEPSEWHRIYKEKRQQA